MAFRTYIPVLRAVMYTAHKYATRWQPQLSESLSADQYACLLATITAIAECLAILGQPSINP